MNVSAGSKVELPLVESVPNITKGVLRYLKGSRMKDAYRSGGFSIKYTKVETSELYSTVRTGRGKKRKEKEVYAGCLVKIRLNGRVGERIHIFIADSTINRDKKEFRPVIVSCYNAKRSLMHYVDADDPDSTKELKATDSTFFGLETYTDWDSLEDGIASAVENYRELCRTGLPHEDYIDRVERKIRKEALSEK